jgi:hypothetical protein
MEKTTETRIVKDSWDLSTYQWRVETDGLKLLVDGFKEKKVLGRKCHKCGTIYIPGQKFCRKCFIDIDQVVEVSDKGSLVSYTATLSDIRGNPFPDPRIAAVVKLDGCDAWLMGQIKGVDYKQLKVGMKLRIVWKEQTSGVIADLDHFGPA